MKNIIYLIIVCLLLVSTSCKKDDDIAPIDQLPPATQIGAGTFGCLVNGEPFFEKNSYFNCFYQFVNGEYFFHIAADSEALNIVEITIYANKFELLEGETYILKDNIENSISGIVFFENIIQYSTTNTEYTGLLNISKLDFQSNVVSGTFNFEVKHPVTGEIIKITDGRFDTLFLK